MNVEERVNKYLADTDSRAQTQREERLKKLKEMNASQDKYSYFSNTGARFINRRIIIKSQEEEKLCPKCNRWLDEKKHFIKYCKGHQSYCRECRNKK
ncbi:MAG: hypothetical protein GY710_06215 [Desulfobacteraceae bacterium]|nr:hypothetical protein [Desulfobacteraceae bacterium]